MTTLVDTIEDRTQLSPEEQIHVDEMKCILEKCLDQLDTRHREVIIRRYGLCGHSAETLEVVGIEVGLTRERVRQLQAAAVKRLKEILGQTDLKDSM